MAKFSFEDIQSLYAGEAEKHGVSGTSTIQDIRTRNKEVVAIFKHVKDGQRVLEVGCGNGYVSAELVRKFKVDLVAFDFSMELIELANKQNLEGILGTVNFSVGDVLQLDDESEYDLVFSERCIQNLTSWEEQAQALRNIAGALKPGGHYIMDECFWTGLNNLNEARAELDLPSIPESWHNNYFYEEQTIDFMQEIGMQVVSQDCFLSGYYFGSRVLLPALLPEGKSASSSSRLNDYFSELPPAGDFSPMKIIQFVKAD